MYITRLVMVWPGLCGGGPRAGWMPQQVTSIWAILCVPFHVWSLRVLGHGCSLSFIQQGLFKHQGGATVLYSLFSGLDKVPYGKTNHFCL